MIAADNWCIKVADKIYGPYSSEKMRVLAQEGRLAAWSLICPAGSREWREAQEEMQFASFFGISKKKTEAPAETIETDQNVSNGNGKKSGVLFGKKATPTSPPAANFIVIFDVERGSAERVSAAMYSLGPSFRMTDNVWSVTCELTAVGVRNAIAPYLTPQEPIFVVDTARGRSSWQNFSLEAQSKISAAYAHGKN